MKKNGESSKRAARSFPRATKGLFLATALLAASTGHAEPPKKLNPPIGVPADAIFFHGKWYKVQFAVMSWTTAKDKCKAAGGQLAVIPDAGTQAFLKKIAGSANVWLGASDARTEGRWVWVDGTPLQFSAWAEGQPDDLDGRQHFLHMVDGVWDDTVRDEKRVNAYICEWRDARAGQAAAAKP